MKKRVAIEAAASFGWERYVGTEGTTITIDHFGASAPGAKILERVWIYSRKCCEYVQSIIIDTNHCLNDKDSCLQVGGSCFLCGGKNKSMLLFVFFYITFK